MRSAPLRTALILVAVLSTLLSVGPVTAHDFGPLSINLYSRLAVDGDRIRLRWVLDMAEIPADAIIKLIDRDEDGSASEDEKAAYLETWISSVLEGIDVTVGGAELPKTVVAKQLDIPVGENGARYLRVVLDLTVALPAATPDGSFRVTYRDVNYEDYIGWREVIVVAGEGAELISSTVPTDDRSDELQTYPPDLWARAPNSAADFTFRVGSSASGPAASDAATRDIADQSGGATDDLVAIGLLVVVLIVVVGAVLGGVGAGRGPRPARR